jgi:hypothetical protein
LRRRERRRKRDDRPKLDRRETFDDAEYNAQRKEKIMKRSDGRWLFIGILSITAAVAAIMFFGTRDLVLGMREMRQVNAVEVMPAPVVSAPESIQEPQQGDVIAMMGSETNPIILRPGTGIDMAIGTAQGVICLSIRPEGLTRADVLPLPGQATPEGGSID